MTERFGALAAWSPWPAGVTVAVPLLAAAAALAVVALTPPEAAGN